MSLHALNYYRADQKAETSHEADVALLDALGLRDHTPESRTETHNPLLTFCGPTVPTLGNPMHSFHSPHTSQSFPNSPFLTAASDPLLAGGSFYSAATTLPGPSGFCAGSTPAQDHSFSQTFHPTAAFEIQSPPGNTTMDSLFTQNSPPHSLFTSQLLPFSNAPSSFYSQPPPTATYPVPYSVNTAVNLQHSQPHYRQPHMLPSFDSHGSTTPSMQIFSAAPSHASLLTRAITPPHTLSHHHSDTQSMCSEVSAGAVGEGLF